jgi:hypothetical protein
MSNLNKSQLVVLFLLAFLANPHLGAAGERVADGAPGPVITQLQSTVIAGEGVEVNAIKSKLSVGSPLTARYKWDFGDPGSAYNNLTGFSAGHFYSKPGTYTITLELTDSAGNTSSATSQVAVNADRRSVIYVDNHGSDDGTGFSTEHPVKTAGRAFALAASNTSILFHRGQTFPIQSTLWLKGHDQLVGAYGAGDKPVLMFAPVDGSQAIIFVGGQSYNITVENLTFDSPNGVTSGPADDLSFYAVWAGGTNLVVIGNTFNNIEDAVNGTKQPSGVIVQDNAAPLLKGMRGYLSWVDGNNWSILGNTVINTTRAHCVRVNGEDVECVLIANNNLTKQYPADDPGEAQKTTIDTRIGSYVYIVNNVLSASTTSISPSPGQTADQQANWVVYEGNYINNGQLAIDEVAHHVLIRHNVLNITATGQIVVNAAATIVPGASISDITITGNTGINTGQDGEFINVFGEPAPGSITITHNVYSGPGVRFGYGWDSAVYINAPDTKGFASIAHNIWPAPHSPLQPDAVNWFAPSGYVTRQQWNSLPNVHNDQFSDEALPPGKFQLTINGVTAGAVNVATLRVIKPTTQLAEAAWQPTTEPAPIPMRPAQPMTQSAQPISLTATQIFQLNDAPASDQQNVNDPTIPAEGVELGTKFNSSVAGAITGVRFYKGSLNTGIHTGQLWNADGKKLATVTFKDESDNGWQQAMFSTPVKIAANTTYIVSYHTSAQFIGYTSGGLTGALNNPPLTALASSDCAGNGVYHYGATAFPTTYNKLSPDYWVDVVFTTTLQH